MTNSEYSILLYLDDALASAPRRADELAALVVRPGDSEQFANKVMERVRQVAERLRMANVEPTTYNLRRPFHTTWHSSPRKAL